MTLKFDFKRAFIAPMNAETAWQYSHESPEKEIMKSLTNFRFFMIDSDFSRDIGTHMSGKSTFHHLMTFLNVSVMIQHPTSIRRSLKSLNQQPESDHIQPEKVPKKVSQFRWPINPPDSRNAYLSALTPAR
jgi:hypothetical protein